MADPYEEACEKSEFGKAHYFYQNKYYCYFQTVNILGNRYVLFINIGLLIVIAFLSIFIRKIYAWILLNQSLLHLYNHIVLIQNSGGVLVVLRNIPYGALPRGTALISPYVTMLGLALSRYIAFYFPHFYDKHVTNKKIFPIILLWDLMCFVPFWIWQYVYFYTDFQECPRYPKNICDIVNTYYTLKDINVLQFYQKDSFNLDKMKNDSIAYDECFEYKTCLRARAQPYNDTVTSYLKAALATIAFILSVFLFVRILKHLKVQLKMNTSSMKTSLRIAVLLLFQALYFFTDNVISISKTAFKSTLVAWMSPRAYTELSNGVYPGLYYFFIFFDSLLIMFLLTDYRFYLLYFIPKQQSHQVSIISSSSTNLR